jgi:hypothetical protein
VGRYANEAPNFRIDDHATTSFMKKAIAILAMFTGCSWWGPSENKARSASVSERQGVGFAERSEENPIPKKNEARIAAGFVYNWCPREDSNLHGFTR